MSRLLRNLVASLALPLALAAPAAATTPLAGAVTGKPYTVTIAKVTAQKGQPAVAHVVIKPVAGYHMNKDYPTGLTLTPPADVKVDKTTLGKEDAHLTEQEGAFDVKLTASAAGAKQIPGSLKFAVCTDTTCDPQKVAIVLDIEVK